MDKDYLILKRASASRPSGEWNDDDFDVLADGAVIGRIYGDASASTRPELRWFWSILEVIPDIETHGHAAARDAAMAAFAKSLAARVKESPGCAPRLPVVPNPQELAVGLTH